MRVLRECWREDESGGRAELAASDHVAPRDSEGGAVRGAEPRDSHGEAVQHPGGGGVERGDLSFFLRADDSAADHVVPAAVQLERRRAGRG